LICVSYVATFFLGKNSQNDEMPIGWPFGLGFLNTRLRDAESLPAAPVEPHSMHIPSTSFSSFSSSNLDTEVISIH